MRRRLAVGVNFLLIAFIGYVNAHLITGVLDGLMASASRPGPTESGIAPPVPEPVPDYHHIVENNIFGAAFDEEEADGVSWQEINTQDATNTALNLCLVGTVVSSEPGHSFAAIQDLDTPNKDVSLHFVGSMIKSDLRLVRVNRTVVFFERLGYAEKLDLCEDGKRKVSETAVAPAPSPPRASSPASPQREAEDRFIIPRATLDDVRQNYAKLFMEARVVPHPNREGVPDGFRIFSIKPGSFFEQIGIKNGDVLHSINGMGVATTQEALKAFAQLEGASRLTLQLERNGSPLTMNYEVR